jgi:hypothetical protein
MNKIMLDENEKGKGNESEILISKEYKDPMNES